MEQCKGTIRYWLLKSEPDAYSIDDLERDGTEPWDGIRNYQARNLMRDEMQVGDRGLFYHSNTKTIGVVGVLEIVSEAYPDPLQFDAKSKYYDAGAKRDAPRWLCVDVAFVERFPQTVTLDSIKADRILSAMPVARKGNRLSITPVTKTQFDRICKLAHKKP